MKSVIAELKKVLNSMQADLHDIFQMSIDSISNQLVQVDIITSDVQKSPSYDAIISQFVGGMKFISTQEELEDYCKVFITALANVGGPLRRAAQMLQQDWIEIVKKQLGVDLQIYDNMTGNYMYKIISNR